MSAVRWVWVRYGFVTSPTDEYRIGQEEYQRLANPNLKSPRELSVLGRDSGGRVGSLKQNSRITICPKFILVFLVPLGEPGRVPSCYDKTYLSEWIRDTFWDLPERKQLLMLSQGGLRPCREP